MTGSKTNIIGEELHRQAPHIFDLLAVRAEEHVGTGVGIFDLPSFSDRTPHIYFPNCPPSRWHDVAEAVVLPERVDLSGQTQLGDSTCAAALHTIESFARAPNPTRADRRATKARQRRIDRKKRRTALR